MSALLSEVLWGPLLFADLSLSACCCGSGTNDRMLPSHRSLVSQTLAIARLMMTSGWICIWCKDIPSMNASGFSLACKCLKLGFCGSSKDANISCAIVRCCFFFVQRLLKIFYWRLVELQPSETITIRTTISQLSINNQHGLMICNSVTTACPQGSLVYFTQSVVQ